MLGLDGKDKMTFLVAEYSFNLLARVYAKIFLNCVISTDTYLFQVTEYVFKLPLLR